MQYMGLTTPYEYKGHQYLIENAIDGLFYWYFEGKTPSMAFRTKFSAKLAAELWIDQIAYGMEATAETDHW